MADRFDEREHSLRGTASRRLIMLDRRAHQCLPIPTNGDPFHDQRQGIGQSFSLLLLARQQIIENGFECPWLWRRHQRWQKSTTGVIWVIDFFILHSHQAACVWCLFIPSLCINTFSLSHFSLHVFQRIEKQWPFWRPQPFTIGMIISDSSCYVSLLLIALASSVIPHGSSSVVARQTKADVCPNVESNLCRGSMMYQRCDWFLSDNACLFAFCDNGGTCMEDSTTAECYRCQCPAGYTGRLCESLVVISRKWPRLLSS